jgi:SAM-dependent methyltransferase
MISLITQAWHDSSYDFRQIACPDDPLSHMFDDWLDYYRLKWAIAKVIQPSSILEIGVRYGYSALSFLQGSPTARYIGIDIDNSEYGGKVGALNWARDKMADYNAQVLVGNSQEMREFPGGQYDLVHVDGQQDGDSTYRDLEKAVKQGKYILVDGYFWSPENYVGCNAFLQDHKDLIEYYFVIPGYAGELLIKVDQIKAALLTGDKTDIDSSQIKNHYLNDYYLSDCGGFEQYKSHNGQRLSDSRLDAVFNIVDVCEGMHVVDAGCGRGELSYASVKAGATVDAVDYSPSAINLARSCFVDWENANSQIDFHCRSIIDFPFARKADRVIASDLVEHLSPNELDLLYANIAQGLNDDGQLVVHTFPNLWFYQYGYEARRTAVAKVGGYLSPEPRSYYERLMHINEQSPTSLRDQLSQHFSHVVLWFGSPENPFDSLHRHYGKSDCVNATSLFAIASNKPIDVDLLKQSTIQAPLSTQQMAAITIEFVEVDLSQCPTGKIKVAVNIKNNNLVAIQSIQPNPVHLAYHWVDSEGKAIVFDGIRTKLPKIGPKQNKTIKMSIAVPRKRLHEQIGLLTLQIGLVQELVAWFESVAADHLLSLELDPIEL